MDTRTPRTPSGGAPQGILDEDPVLSMIKVPSDPAQVVVNYVSFRVRLAQPAPRSHTVDTARLRAARVRAGDFGAGSPVIPSPTAPSVAARATASAAGRRPGSAASSGGHPVAHRTSGRRLLHAARVPPAGLAPSVPPEVTDGGATTRTLPLVDEPASTALTPTVVGPRGPRPRPPETTRPPVTGQSQAWRGAGADGAAPTPRRGDTVRQAYYPGRGLNLGLVLLPLRIFLGFMSIYAGMGKLCDPVYFDGGDGGSMVTWLRTLEPWAIATPLYEFALAHPVVAGLTVAFLQVIAGVLTIFGLWQRVAAATGALLSVALLVTVSWRAAPAYEAPDIIYLAAWSPLLIAGAPAYSADSRLTGEAWRKLGPRVDVWDLRRRVVRRGATMAAVVVGLALLVGALLGGAVRSSRTAQVSEPGQPPTNQVPGSPLPDPPTAPSSQASEGPTGSRAGGAVGSPSPSAPSAGSTSAPDDTATVPGGQRTVSGSGSQATSAPGQTTSPSVTSGAGATGAPGGGSTSAAGGTSTGSATTGASQGGASSAGGGSGGNGALGGLFG